MIYYSEGKELRLAETEAILSSGEEGSPVSSYWYLVLLFTFIVNNMVFLLPNDC